MRKLSPILLIPLLFLLGCAEEEGPVPTVPENLTLTVIENGLGLRLDWQEVPDADGYYVYFVSAPYEGGTKGDIIRDTIVLVKMLTNRFYDSSEDSINTYYPSSIEDRNCGDYYVKAVAEDECSEASNSVTSVPLTMGHFTLYEQDYNDSCAFGWDETGNGRIYSINDMTDEWDVYLSDMQPGVTDPTDFRLMSPPIAGAPWDTTLIAIGDDEHLCPCVMWPQLNTAMEPDGVYFLRIEEDYFVSITVLEIFENGIVFDYSFQKLGGFRRF
ncbi:hypothetical protein CH333_03835 [candidate division WOR-3 bacterium JGI_Cruoil_03_44_89]|uniref:Fibronectin type-III domain-containing protein n=1 Tax=candidate division WOR-3 bacterium JGI_Cruoil_03_44_89 TaxID=1973748 RepID=A0A235BXJ2_UNCW3|nr:MAG: hypothetical protein CH333_03835 [candidate division WOR-3 bacterium JGI_Cruoil_03_44_89]